MLPKANFGRSDRIRTCGIDVPNVARYQLRHTPKIFATTYIITDKIGKVNRLFSFFFVFLYVFCPFFLQIFVSG